jgi:hypothetical protein
MRRRYLPALVVISALSLAGCGAGGSPTSQPPAPVTPEPPSQVNYDVTNCFDQIIPGSGGYSLRTLIVPDTMKLDLTRAPGYPNGRRLTDPVIDIVLAAELIDFTVTGQGPRTLANLPFNPPGNDVPFDSNFPYLAHPQGSPPRVATTGTHFDFRTDPDESYTRVDRAGQPAVSTVLIGSASKASYNDSNPSSDNAGAFRDEQKTQLTNLFKLIGDDLTGLGLKLCASSQ